MQDYTNLHRVQEEADTYVTRLFDLIEAKGGIVERNLYLSPKEAFDATFHTKSPWISRYFGERFSSWDSVCEAAIELAFSGDKRKVPDAMRGLANNLYRQATPVWHISRHSLSENLSMVSRLRHSLELVLRYESDIYTVNQTEPAALNHYLGYIYKYSPLSQYCPDIWINNLKGYGEARPVSLSDKELEILAEAVVALQQGFGISEHVHELTPNSLEDTQIRSLNTNPTSAYSLPTMSNAKNKDARLEQLELAKEYRSDPWLIGNVPYIGQRRIQQGGNVLKEYFERVSPGFDASSQFPTLAMFDEAMKLISVERPWNEYYSKDRVVQDGYSKIKPLPNSMEEREQLVDQGYEGPAILLRFKDGSFRFNFKVSEPSPWKLVMDDDASKAAVSGTYSSMMLSKNRVVFAGSNPIALNKQSYVHRQVDAMKVWTEENGNRHLTASWKEPTDMRNILTNMVAAVNGVEDCTGKIVTVDSEDLTIFGNLSGDDKSSFDQFQSWILWATFNCCIMGPCFDPSTHEVLKATSLQTCMPQMMAFDGMYAFSEAMPSGEGSTNFQDGYISAVAGLFDVSQRSGISPKRIMALWKKYNTGMLFQGDDFEGTDQVNVSQQDKQNNFSKLGVNLSVPKSLISPTSFEYVRQFTDGNWRYYPGSSKANIVAMHAPLMHALVKVDFGEAESSISPAIDDVSNINRLGNLQFHPNFINICKEMCKYSKMALGTKVMWYVPLYNVKAWRDNGSPKGPSKYHVRIDSPQALVKIASKEAGSIGENISSITDKSWMAQFDDTSKFEEQRVVKVLNAIRTSNNKELNRLAAMVKYQPIYNS